MSSESAVKQAGADITPWEGDLLVPVIVGQMALAYATGHAQTTILRQLNPTDEIVEIIAQNVAEHPLIKASPQSAHRAVAGQDLVNAYAAVFASFVPESGNNTATLLIAEAEEAIRKAAAAWVEGNLKLLGEQELNGDIPEWLDDAAGGGPKSPSGSNEDAKEQTEDTEMENGETAPENTLAGEDTEQHESKEETMPETETTDLQAETNASEQDLEQQVDVEMTDASEAPETEPQTKVETGQTPEADAEPEVDAEPETETDVQSEIPDSEPLGPDDMSAGAEVEPEIETELEAKNTAELAEQEDEKSEAVEPAEAESSAAEPEVEETIEPETEAPALQSDGTSESEDAEPEEAEHEQEAEQEQEQKEEEEEENDSSNGKTEDLDNKTSDSSKSEPRQSSSATLRAAKKWQTKALNTINDILAWRSSSIFATPVTGSDYEEVVHQPTDLRTIKAAIKDGSIVSGDALDCEVQRMFANAVMFNPSKSDTCKFAREGQTEATKRIHMFREFDDSAAIVAETPKRRRR